MEVQRPDCPVECPAAAGYSGFYGILRPFDGATPYRLEMQAKLKIGECKDLYAYTYEAYTQSVVEQRQEHLLITARAVSQNLSRYLSEQLLDVDILVHTPGFLEECERYYQTRDNTTLKEYILSYMLNQQSIVARMYLFDQEGNEIFHYNQYPFLEAFDESILHLPELCERRQTSVGTAFRITNQHYGLTLVNTINSKNSHMGTIVTILDMQELYRKFVAPLDIQKTGIIIVKNHRGTVIMHPNLQMLTFNYFRDIYQLETLPQYESLHEMLLQQYTVEEGSAIYRSYSNGISPPQDEIAAFSRMNLGETTWYVSAVIPYSQVTNQISENMGRYGLLVAAIFLVVSASILIIYALQKNRQKLQMEANYLRNINHTLEELHQSREQVRHYQKLQTLGALAGGIVHEFNNLLTPIMGYSEFLKDQMGPDSIYYEDMDEIYKPFHPRNSDNRTGKSRCPASSEGKADRQDHSEASGFLSVFADFGRSTALRLSHSMTPITMPHN